MSAAMAHIDGVSVGDQKPCLTLTQERVKAIAIGCSRPTKAEPCWQAVSYLREHCGLEHILHGQLR